MSSRSRKSKVKGMIEQPEQDMTERKMLEDIDEIRFLETFMKNLRVRHIKI